MLTIVHFALHCISGNDSPLYYLPIIYPRIIKKPTLQMYAYMVIYEVCSSLVSRSSAQSIEVERMYIS